MNLIEELVTQFSRDDYIKLVERDLLGPEYRNLAASVNYALDTDRNRRDEDIIAEHIYMYGSYLISKDRRLEERILREDRERYFKWLSVAERYYGRLQQASRQSRNPEPVSYGPDTRGQYDLGLAGGVVSQSRNPEPVSYGQDTRGQYNLGLAGGVVSQSQPRNTEYRTIIPTNTSHDRQQQAQQPVQQAAPRNTAPKEKIIPHDELLACKYMYIPSGSIWIPFGVDARKYEKNYKITKDGPIPLVQERKDVDYNLHQTFDILQQGINNPVSNNVEIEGIVDAERVEYDKTIEEFDEAQKMDKALGQSPVSHYLVLNGGGQIQAYRSIGGAIDDIGHVITETQERVNGVSHYIRPFMLYDTARLTADFEYSGLYKRLSALPSETGLMDIVNLLKQIRNKQFRLVQLIDGYLTQKINDILRYTIGLVDWSITTAVGDAADLLDSLSSEQSSNTVTAFNRAIRDCVSSALKGLQYVTRYVVADDDNELSTEMNILNPDVCPFDTIGLLPEILEPSECMAVFYTGVILYKIPVNLSKFSILNEGNTFLVTIDALPELYQLAERAYDHDFVNGNGQPIYKDKVLLLTEDGTYLQIIKNLIANNDGMATYTVAVSRTI